MTLIDLPVLDIYEQSDTRLCCSVDMRDNLGCFSGHFPELPILSGVMQLHWVILLAKQYWYPRGKFSGVPRIKFQCPIQPQDILDIELTNKSNGKINYTYKSRGHVMSSGSFDLISASAGVVPDHV